MDQPDLSAIADAMDHTDLTVETLKLEEVFIPTHFGCYPVSSEYRSGTLYDNAYCLEFTGLTGFGEPSHIHVMWPKEKWNAFLRFVNAEHFPGEPCKHNAEHSHG